jgi:hypothetical protein
MSQSLTSVSRLSYSIQDPLGIAVHQTFGIGLGFKFDHMSKIKESELPSTRRLQARAAKSAIKRALELYDAQNATAELDKIADPIERSKKAAELRQAVDEEIKLLGQRLTELIPNDLSLDRVGDAKVQQYDSNSFIHASANEYVMPFRGDKSQSLESLFKSQKGNLTSAADEIDYLNPMGDSNDGVDDEFINEWMKRYLDRGNSTNEENDDQENAVQTFLV